MLDALSVVRALVGGVMIGLAAALLLLSEGRIAGISGVVGRLFAPDTHDRSWRVSFLAGLLGGGVLIAAVHPSALGPPMSSSWALLGIAGVLVGVGTQLGNGCTSGHGVCGISRGSMRSVVATMVFMATAMATVFVQRKVAGG